MTGALRRFVVWSFSLGLAANPPAEGPTAYVYFSETKFPEHGNRSRSGVLLYMTSDGIWLRLSGGLEERQDRPGDYRFVFREGHTQETGRWTRKEDKLVVVGERWYMGVVQMEPKDINEVWVQSKCGDTKCIDMMGFDGEVHRLKLIRRHSPERRVISLLETARKSWRAKLKK